MTVISVIVGSTREGRFSEKPAKWILDHLKKRDGVDARLLDLRDFPMMNMKDSKTLLLEYLASVRDPERAASLFAEDGAFELPFLRSLGVEPRHTGRREIARLIHQLLKLYPNFAFGPDDTRVLIETPEKTFAEYVGHGRAAATGRTLHQLFTGYLVAEAGEIKLIRESFNPLAMAQAQLPHGAADIPPPGDDVHSF